MNNQDLLNLFGHASLRYVADADEAALPRHGIGRKKFLLIAAILILSLALVACAVARLILFDSTREMIDAIFGNQTGFDHKEITYWTDTEKPGSVYENPAYDRVPVDTNALEEVESHISPVGQSITMQNVTLTVDAYLYDTKTRCGVVTYIVNAPEGMLEYDTDTNGRVWFDNHTNSGITFGLNQYGYTYLIPDKTSATALALRYYFRYNAWKNEPIFVELSYENPENSLESIEKRCEKEVRQQYTPEEAVAEVTALWGEDFFTGENEAYWQQRAEETKVPGASAKSECAYKLLRDDRSCREYQESKEIEKIELDITRNAELNSVSLGNGTGYVSPISLVLDARKNQALQDADGGFKDYGTLSVVLNDGSEYVIKGNGVSNQVFSRISPHAEATTEELQNGIQNTELTVMFNRLIDVDSVEAVVIDGIRISKD